MSDIKIPLSGSDKIIDDPRGPRNYAGAYIQNPFPAQVFLTPQEALQTINILSGLLAADVHFKTEAKRFGS
jgi:hypothetical protein